EQLKIDENEALQLLPILDFCNQIFDPGGKFCFKIIKPIFRSISFFVNISTSFGRIKRLSDPQISSEVLTAFSTSIRRETTKTIFGNLSFFVDISMSFGHRNMKHIPIYSQEHSPHFILYHIL
ncbi:14710_t:CDS:2, partial [Gigaspora rosea]